MNQLLMGLFSLGFFKLVPGKLIQTKGTGEQIYDCITLYISGYIVNNLLIPCYTSHYFKYNRC